MLWIPVVVALLLIGSAGFVALLGSREAAAPLPPAAEASGRPAPPAREQPSPAPSRGGAGETPDGDPDSAPGLEVDAASDPPSFRTAREQAYLRDEAGEALARAADLREALDDQGVSIWGPEEMRDAAAVMATADAALTDGRYREARDGYAAAGAILDGLRERAPRVLAEALADGEAALEAGRMTEAAAAFSLALRLAPGDERARAGLRSAESLDRVLALLNEGDGHERAGRLTEAAAAYRRALDLDPGSRPAREALARVRHREQAEVLSAALSEGLAELEAGRFGEARAAFGRAGRIDPGSPLVADGLARVDEAEKLQEIAAHRKRATAAEADERWRDALAEHEAALALDATLTFAQEGRERTARRADMQESLAAFIAGAARLGDEKVAAEAAALLEEARSVTPAGPRHQAQVEELARWLDVMSRTLPVTLLSDGKTEVTVYRVGRLGAFQRHELELRPGAYTVLGQRDGYRDVRLTLTVKPDQPPEPLEIRCQERL